MSKHVHLLQTVLAAADFFVVERFFFPTKCSAKMSGFSA